GGVGRWARLFDRRAALGIGWRRAEKLTPDGKDLGPLALPAIIFRFILAGPQFTLHVDLAAFREVLATRLSHLAESHDLMPFRVFLALAVLVSVGLVGGHRKAADRLAAWQIPEFGILSQMTDESYLVQRHPTFLL